MSETDWKTPLPPQAFWLARLLNPLHRFFDWLYHSRYNPLYRSGTLAMGFLVILLISGLYLIFFYSISQPYESVAVLQGQVASGRWIRALHRYATDGAVIAVVFHILQLLAQGKTWGPRVLAWVSGIILLIVLFLSAWTGYVMVWDLHGQLLAVTGAKMLEVFPFLREPLAQAFDGSVPISQSFFFMNLFLHVALPVAMILGMWVHTARLSRSRWFPIRKIFVASILSFVALAICWPAVLLEKASLTSVPGRIPVDWFVGFWTPMARHSPGISLLLWVVGIALLLSIPWWWKPSARNIRKSSHVDVDRCSGCTQCARDCPYEAIAMAPRDDGRRLVAVVDSRICVSCGMCAASCDDLCIGPPERSGSEQLCALETFCAEQLENVATPAVVAIVCKHNGYVPKRWQEFEKREQGTIVYPVDCCGTVHTQAIEKLLEHFAGVFFHACPERNCFNRDGLELLSQRMFFKRVPFLARHVDQRRIYVDASSEREIYVAHEAARQFRASLRDLDSGKYLPPRSPSNLGHWFRGVVASVLILLGIACGSQIPLGRPSKSGILRIGAKIPHASLEVCHQLSDEEKKALPKHMQPQKVCEQTPLHYVLRVSIDGRDVVKREVSLSGIRGDSPLFVSEDIEVEPGSRTVIVDMTPTETIATKEHHLYLEQVVLFQPRRVFLITYDSQENRLKPASEKTTTTS